ncbi:hypothetical protein RUND412_010151 [Rhizina undulata]
MAAPLKIAIVGSGVSGLAAFWALRNSGRNYELHLYEANDYLGGHAHSVLFGRGGMETWVDTGFIVMNAATYPNFLAFLAFLAHIKVPTTPTEMSFSVSRDNGRFEWAGPSIHAVFSQRGNVFSLRMWRMLFDIIRFNTFALDLLRQPDSGAGSRQTIGEYLEKEGYSDAFREDYLIPMMASVWSTDPDKCAAEFPAVTLVRFMWNHSLLNTISSRPKWKTIPGGAKRYVDEIVEGFPKERIHLSTPVTSIGNNKDGTPFLTLGGDETKVFYDRVVLATHGDQSLELLGMGATEVEREILGCFKTSSNIAVLHSDFSLMPHRPLSWSACNYLSTSTTAPNSRQKVSVTYNMNALQHIPTTFGPVLVTLNPLQPPKPLLTQGSWSYSHPLYTPTAISAQSRIHEIQNKRGIMFAGTWAGYGFHEDGFTSGIRVAREYFGVDVSWNVVDSRGTRGEKLPRRGVLGLWVRLIVGLVQLGIVVLGFAAELLGGTVKVKRS